MLFWKRKKTSSQDQTLPSKPQVFNTAGLEALLSYVKKEIGIDLFVKHDVIETKLRLFCERQEIYSFQTLYDKILYDASLKQALIDLVTVNETYFYREEAQLDLAVSFALNIPNVRILCAPCASGEEVYSLAMKLQEKNKREDDFTIKGIDINSEAIQKAQNGLFSERSLHKLDASVKSRFFTYETSSYRIKQSYFTSVSFTRVNIFDDAFLSLGTFDIIFSRNMLIYFDDAVRLKTVERFQTLLKPEGKLFLGHADIIPENRHFTKMTENRLSYYVNNQKHYM